MHAYRRGRTGQIGVSAKWDGGVLTIIVKDAGRGLRPGSERPGLGAGLTIIARLAGLRLSMRFDPA